MQFSFCFTLSGVFYCSVSQAIANLTSVLSPACVLSTPHQRSSTSHHGPPDTLRVILLPNSSQYTGELTSCVGQKCPHGWLLMSRGVEKVLLCFLEPALKLG